MTFCFSVCRSISSATVHGKRAPHLVGRLVVPADEADFTLDDLDVSDVPSGRISKVLGRDLRPSSGATGRDVHGGEEQGTEMIEALEEFGAGGGGDGGLPPGVDEVSISETGVVHENVQQEVPDANEAVPGDVCEEKVGEGAVWLVARFGGEFEVETGVGVGEPERDVAFLVGDVLQQGPERVADVVQADDRVVQDGRSSDDVGVRGLNLVLDQLL